MVLRSPPDAVATHHSEVSLRATAISVMRPPMLAGPMERQLRLLSHLESTSSEGVADLASSADAELPDLDEAVFFCSPLAGWLSFWTSLVRASRAFSMESRRFSLLSSRDCPEALDLASGS